MHNALKLAVALVLFSGGAMEASAQVAFKRGEVLQPAAEKEADKAAPVATEEATKPPSKTVEPAPKAESPATETVPAKAPGIVAPPVNPETADKPVSDPKTPETVAKPEEKPADPTAPRQSLADQQGIKPTGEVLTYVCDEAAGKCDFAE